MEKSFWQPTSQRRSRSHTLSKKLTCKLNFMLSILWILKLTQWLSSLPHEGEVWVEKKRPVFLKRSCNQFSHSMNGYWHVGLCVVVRTPSKVKAQVHCCLHWKIFERWRAIHRHEVAIIAWTCFPKNTNWWFRPVQVLWWRRSFRCDEEKERKKRTFHWRCKFEPGIPTIISH